MVEKSKKKSKKKINKGNKGLYISVLIVALLVISSFAFSGYLGSVLFGPGNNPGTAVVTDNNPPNNPAAVDNTGVEEEPAEEPAENTAGPPSDLSNKKIGWGLKRNNNHQQPEMPSYIKSTLAKYGAYWIGSPAGKVLYLTFDEGYENGYTPRILDILKENGIKAAFFVSGSYLKSQPDLVRRMVNEGHIVGNHTDTHPSLPDVSDARIKQELLAVEQDFEKITGQKGMKYLRPPMGEYSERTLSITRDMGYHNIFWSLALVDWVPLPGGPQESYDSVMSNLHNGALILLHAVSKDNTEALDRILKDARAQGYSFRTLDQLVSG